jgi:hypothetical protein
VGRRWTVLSLTGQNGSACCASRTYGRERQAGSRPICCFRNARCGFGSAIRGAERQQGSRHRWDRGFFKYNGIAPRAPHAPIFGHVGRPSSAQSRRPETRRPFTRAADSGLRHVRLLRLRPPGLAQLQAAVHPLSIYREELRRPLTMAADALATWSRIRIIGA